jgi:hypothetical protein
VRRLQTLRTILILHPLETGKPFRVKFVLLE